MSWNPSINFKLRDDQVAFGDLVVDKNGVPAICEALKSIREGKPIDTMAFSEVLKNWCYKDEEFEHLKEEFEQIKIDIVEFKNITSSFGARWTASLQSMGAAVDYIAGSSTWIEKYKENKSIAAGLYRIIKDSGYKFGPEKEREYDIRYHEVISATTKTECVEEYLKKQYRENLASGDRDALRKYCDALVETGCLTPEAARKKMETMSMFERASGDFVEKYEVHEMEHKAPEEDKQLPAVVITQAMIKQWYPAIEALDGRGFPMEADTAMNILFDIMLKVFTEAEIPGTYVKYDPIDSKEKLWESAKSLWGILIMNQNAGLIDCADVTYDGAEIEKMVQLGSYK